ncbi:alpha/beta hydrolase [Nonomuraea phyllanthi]|uniref:Alpha/beta hydrolase n=1 Tax=Nonomuraea phyllanthi TaxID=2219224 RepID=A0A5C4VZC5_9ACTN|nr:alpha/beta hydrolase [Nonomuraea phyllanthi]KAB8190806.1 alpha/beta hydrolase [Nonomuraea phyllanthi]QFY11802.1 alpha/beta hydrolase [Nonomuraea phyllanthi]
MVPERIFGFPTRHQGDPDRVAVLLPGGGYMPARPLLHYARTVLAHHGWTVQEVWWEPPTAGSYAEREAWVVERARAAVDAESAGQVLLVGKSLGTLAASFAAERRLPAIWLTPLLNVESVVAGVRRSQEPTLLVGGTADTVWDAELVRGLGHPYLEVPDANHGMEIVEDPVRSAGILRDVTAEMARFVSGLRS